MSYESSFRDGTLDRFASTAKYASLTSTSFNTSWKDIVSVTGSGVFLYISSYPPLVRLVVDGVNGDEVSGANSRYFGGGVEFKTSLKVQGRRSSGSSSHSPKVWYSLDQ